MSLVPAIRSAAGTCALRAAACLLPLAISAATLAQGAPPEPRVTRTYPVWIGYGIGAILIVIIVLVSLMPSKRAHQD